MKASFAIIVATTCGLLTGCKDEAAGKTVLLERLLDFSDERAEFRNIAGYLYATSSQCPATTPKSLETLELSVFQEKMKLKEKLQNNAALRFDVDVLSSNARLTDGQVFEAECAFNVAKDTPENIKQYKDDFKREQSRIDAIEAAYVQLAKKLES